ncbi:MAG: hypothetical protein LBL82_05940 [Oscillospiraceae bacterium]|jgi:hypothetical protein|nr:hypothetical protein [Oscillospiraceae bacterium]
MKKKKEYDFHLKNKAITGLGLRLAVAGYVCFMAYQIVSNALAGDTSMSVATAVTFAVIFSVAALGFAVYSVMAYQAALSRAEIKPEEELPLPSDDDSEDGEEDTAPTQAHAIPAGAEDDGIPPDETEYD